MKKMKRILCFIIMAVFIIAPTSSAFAKNNKPGHDKKKGNKITYQEKKLSKKKKQEFKIKKSPVIKHGRYKLPVTPVTKGMGATVIYDKDKDVITVIKDDVTIVLDLRNETVTVNGVADTKNGIFGKKKNNGMTVLIKYIASILGNRVEFDDDEIIVEVPGLDYPTNIVITPVGSVTVPNTLNTSTLYLTATASIKAGQATGGKAELYVGSKLLATDTTINATDTTVTFSTSDGTPTNQELQTAVPVGGELKVKLYNATGKSVMSKPVKQKLIVDYSAPTLAGIQMATYDAKNSKLVVSVTGAAAVGDKVDVTKLTLVDNTQGRSYQLTNNSEVGSKGTVTAADTLTIQIGSGDKFGLTGFGITNVTLNVTAGSLLSDAAGNVSQIIPSSLTLPVTVIQGLDQPTNITITPIGSAFANTLNASTLYVLATADIIPGQATGGRAELYVGSKLVAMDADISATDTTVTFGTSDGSPANAELQSIIPVGGEVKVKLYNTAGQSVISTKNNPTLVVDYTAPIINGISSAIYNVSGNHLYLNVSGAGTVGDKLDVTKITIYDSTKNRLYQLTNQANTGSTGVVVSESLLRIDLGSVDRKVLAGFEGPTVTLAIAPGALITDEAGNQSTNFTTIQTVPVTLIR